MQQLTYRLDQFEGPLDLLLSLIQKNKYNIFDIPISIICDQYMAYINEAGILDLEISSDFIVMASRLMLIKSRLLLPKQTEIEEDPRAELAAAVIEYARIKKASLIFGTYYSLYNGRFEKDTDEIKPDNKLEDGQYQAEQLAAALRRILSDTKKVEAASERLTPLIKKRVASATEKAYSVMRYLLKNGKTDAEVLFSREQSYSDIIAVFLAILELLRSQRVEMSVINEDTDIIAAGIADSGVIPASRLTLTLLMNHDGRNRVNV